VKQTVGAAGVLTAIRVLVNPTKITSACDALGDTINELAEAKEPGETKPRVPTKEQQQAMEYLLRYVRGLNRGRGMGFVIQRKRISYSFVLTMSVRAASAMLFIFPLMLSLTKVEEEEAEEEELLNTTCVACAAACGL
jgi:hypothetical protein